MGSNDADKTWQIFNQFFVELGPIYSLVIGAGYRATLNDYSEMEEVPESVKEFIDTVGKKIDDLLEYLVESDPTQADKKARAQAQLLQRLMNGEA